ncbi:YbhB/YbcL family Raf kinase inhibitor-like protein [Dehalogenimonas sp. 4OHTPN]|uniref:YbhB/YbcL family Raf kinase inhibitor-like protein n=1 Tax=Dehalogenimonas sp. 4OHTPN TaxID=3166643 RepID=A0AAU8GAS4_9CHLR
MEMIIDGFKDGGLIPKRNTCDGPGLSPEISWKGIPPGAKSLALLMDDPDAPRGLFTHWIIWNIPVSAFRLPAGTARKAELPNGMMQGVNSGGAYGYYPSCPPPGSVHHYRYRLMALDAVPVLNPGAGREQFDRAVSGHVLAEVLVTGLYSR